jgi:hypothetical protein
MSSLDAHAAAAARTALDVVAASLGPRGQWPSWAITEPSPGPGERDISPPITAMGMLAVQGLAEADDLLARSRMHLELTVLPGGMWRYYANIPPDTDDSAMCALALGPRHLIAEQTRATIAATVLPDGRFPTWFEPGWHAAVDAVPNANIVALLGEVEETAAAVEWLVTVIETGHEVQSSLFYIDALDLHLAIRRAVDAGVTSLRSSLAIAQERARQRIAAGGLSPYRCAQAVAVAQGTLDQPLRDSAHAALLDTRTPDGTWPRETLFVAARADGPGRCLYQSWSVVTALCARALLT